MDRSPLNIVSAGPSQPHKRLGERREGTRDRSDTTRARFERLWLLTPEIFDPNRTVINRTRIARTWDMIQKSAHPSSATVAADLGFGWGELTRKLASIGTQVDALDAATQALKRFEIQPVETVKLIRGVVPLTDLPDQRYDLVICTDLIADLHANDQRLLISELYRISKPKGKIILSTPLNIDSEGAMEKLIKLIETELAVEEWSLSYHSYYLRLLRFLKTPERYVRAKRDAQYRDQQLAKRSVLSAKWLQLQCRQPFGFFWFGISKLSTPLANQLEQSTRILGGLESICRAVKTAESASHVICVLNRKPLEDTAVTAPSTMSRPVQRLRERVWE